MKANEIVKLLVKTQGYAIVNVRGAQVVDYEDLEVACVYEDDHRIFIEVEEEKELD